MDKPLSQSRVPLKLEEIQKRCSELQESPESELELSLEDTMNESAHSDPYNQQRG
jgi:hypothetical protein